MNAVRPQEGMTFDYWCRKILPIGAIAALCLSTGNIPYLWLSVRLRALPCFPLVHVCCRQLAHWPLLSL